MKRDPWLEVRGLCRVDRRAWRFSRDFQKPPPRHGGQAAARKGNQTSILRFVRHHGRRRSANGRGGRIPAGR